MTSIKRFEEFVNEDIKVDDRLFDCWTSDRYDGVSKYGKENGVDIYDAANALVYFDWVKDDRDEMIKKLTSLAKGKELAIPDKVYVSWAHVKRVR